MVILLLRWLALNKQATLPEEPLIFLLKILPRGFKEYRCELFNTDLLDAFVLL
jgi:hypothetical protein